MNRTVRRILCLWVVAAAATSATRAAVPTYKPYTLRQYEDGQRADTVSMPSPDLDGDGLRDVLVVLSTGHVRIFRLGKDGYPASPTETWRLPDDAAWVDVADLTDDPGLEMLVGTATGVVYYRQKDGRFRPEPVRLVEAPQDFGEAMLLRPQFTGSFRQFAGRNYEQGLPVVQDGRVVLWQRGADGSYAPGNTVDLRHEWVVKRDLMSESARREVYDPRWAAGDARPQWLNVQAQAMVPGKAETEASNEPAQRLLDRLRTSGSYWEAGMDTDPDINGDGRRDALIFIMKRQLQVKTDFHLLLRRSDGQLPDEADQILTVDGAPVGWEPLRDVDGDGRLELLTVELRDMPTSVRAIAEVALSGQVDCTLVVRRCDGRQFVPRPVAQMDLKVAPGSPVHVLHVDGDFNGDGRPDLQVFASFRRTDVHLSTPGKRLPFERSPSLHFEVAEGFYISGVLDLNGDGFGDPVLESSDRGRTMIYLSQGGTRR